MLSGHLGRYLIARREPWTPAELKPRADYTFGMDFYSGDLPLMADPAPGIKPATFEMPEPVKNTERSGGNPASLYQGFANFISGSLERLPRKSPACRSDALELSRDVLTKFVAVNGLSIRLPVFEIRCEDVHIARRSRVWNAFCARACASSISLIGRSLESTAIPRRSLEECGLTSSHPNSIAQYFGRPPQCCVAPAGFIVRASRGTT